MTNIGRPALRQLADRVGILPGYVDILGKERHTSDSVREALLAAMGYDGSMESLAAAALAELDRRDAERLLRPVRVARPRPGRGIRAEVRLPPPVVGEVAWTAVLRDDQGRSRTLHGRRDARRRSGSLILTLPPLSQGYYAVELVLRWGGAEWTGSQLLVVVPNACPAAQDLLERRPGFGVIANLYTVRSPGSWGVGDFEDLDTLVTWGGEAGTAFIGLNPLHALRNAGWEISPYSPASRLFRNPLYLRLERVPELADHPAARALIESGPFREDLDRLGASNWVDYEAVMARKRAVLELLHQEFAARHRGRGTDRGVAYRRYLESQGAPLEDFATFCALAEVHGWDWRCWPYALRDAGSADVHGFRSANPESVDLHRYVQFELDRQLGEIGARARARMPLGLLGDLALGSSGTGSDAWSFSSLFVHGATVGAPPDDYAAAGQDWGFPPLDPTRLTEERYSYWILLVRNALQHLGALRVDHVMGLFRQFWIPRGCRPTEGAYVRYPVDDLLGILALEAIRGPALIVGEDLGTVPSGFSRILARRNVLSSRVLYFERDHRGGFRSAGRYSKRALTTITTHDHPPLAGFWEGRDLVLRREAGALPSDDVGLSAARTVREGERQALLDLLVREGLLERGSQPTRDELLRLVHVFLSRTASPLVGIMLDDLAAETDPVNLPGVPLDRYRSWSRKMRVPIADVLHSGRSRDMLAAFQSRRQPR